MLDALLGECLSGFTCIAYLQLFREMGDAFTSVDDVVAKVTSLRLSEVFKKKNCF